MWNLKLRMMASIGAISIVLGVAVRFCARFWTRDYSSGYIDHEARQNIVEVGTWAIAFGVIVLALSLHQWVSGDPKPDNSATQS